MTYLVHVRQRPTRSRRGVDAAGQIRPLRGEALENDPRRRTLCGAEPTDRDLSHRTGHSKAGRDWITCHSCRKAVRP